MAKTARRIKKVEVRKAATMASASLGTEDTGTGPIFFWREYDSQWGFLSQWYESPFHTEDKSIVYQTAEQYNHLRCFLSRYATNIEQIHDVPKSPPLL